MQEGLVIVMGNDSKGIVLVTDDNMDTLGILNETLVNEGYTVLVAMDGVQALAIANRIVPDVILMDALMPNMNGFDACKELKKNSDLSNVPVIFMTGLSDSEHVITGLDAGGVDYITKPINLEEMLARIKVHLNNARFARSTRNALDEIGPLALACDVNGQLKWCTDSARSLLSSTGADSEWIEHQLSIQISSWLTHDPEKNTTYGLQGLDKPLQIRFLGRLSPGEYLMRLMDDDELRIRAALRDQFSLTAREAEVLHWLSRGKTNREIGQILSMSPRTVNKHLEGVFRKLNVENRTSATMVCLRFLCSR
jgi:DNA-binding NarL/FixJ family response regulator